MELSTWIFVIALILGCALSPACAQEADVQRITVDCSKEVAKMSHIWRITHVYPGRRLLDADLRQEMNYLGGLPHGIFIYIRPHDLLDMVEVEGFGTDDARYDWSKLDNVIDMLLNNGLKPFIEIMGVPDGVPKVGHNGPGVFTPEVWKILVRDLALHYIEKYGSDEVRSWYFESWNEPEGYMEKLWNYYDACSEGLKEVDPELKFGGPNTYVTLGPAFTAFMEHCDKGKNYFTGETGLRLDYISVHEKGIKRIRFTDANPDVKEWIDREIAVIKYIRTHHPRFTDTLYVNDECDGKGGIAQSYSWRGGPYFPAILAKYTRHHLQRLVDEMGVKTMVSDDSAIVGGWGQASHIVRFGEENKFEVMKKPLNNGMLMFCMLGDKRCEIEQPDLFSDVGAIATKSGNEQIAVLVYNCNEVGVRENHGCMRIVEQYALARIELRLENLPFTEGMIAHYRLDKEHSNPQRIWEELGSPDEPTADQFAKMRAHQELTMLDGPREVQAKDGELLVDFDLPMPGVSLILISSKPERGPGRLTRLHAERSPSALGLDEIMLIWKPSESRVIRTYEVLYAESEAGPFQRVNGSDLISAAFLHVRGKTGGKGYYRVRAVDYWGRAGRDSQIVPCPS